MERLVNGPFKAGGWVTLVTTYLAFRYNDLAVITTLVSAGFGVALISAGPWMSALRSARLERYDGWHWASVAEINRVFGDDRST